MFQRKTQMFRVERDGSRDICDLVAHPVEARPDALLGDGSVQPETSGRLRDQFKNSGNDQNLIAIPD